jgi:hypothetical protein
MSRYMQGTKMSERSCTNCKCGNTPESQAMGETQYKFFSFGELVKEYPTENYTVTISSPGTGDGHRIAYRADVSIFDYYNIFQEYFNGSNFELEIEFDSEEE